MNFLDVRIIQKYVKNKVRRKRKPGEYRGENLYKIKTPCFCMFTWRGRERLGSITCSGYKKDGKFETPQYVLTDYSKQTLKDVGDVISLSPNLKKMIKKYKIRILRIEITGIDTIHSNLLEDYPNNINCRCTLPILEFDNAEEFPNFSITFGRRRLR
jgi:hypothetical protein